MPMEDIPPTPTVLSALRVLSRVWSVYRPEGVELSAPQLAYRRFPKKYYVWEVCARYGDPRAEDHPAVPVAFVFVPPNTTVGVDLAKYLVKQYSVHARHLVIVCTKSSRSTGGVLDASGMVWESVSYDDVGVCIMDSGLVHSYTVLVGAGRAEAMASLGLATENELARLPLLRYREDPVARLLGLREGDLVRVKSPCTLTGQDVTYRYVVPSDAAYPLP